MNTSAIYDKTTGIMMRGGGGGKRMSKTLTSNAGVRDGHPKVDGLLGA